MEVLKPLCVALAAVIASWGALALLFTGIGMAVRRLPSGDDAPLPLGDSFWTGWAVAIGGLQVWHLLLPVDGWAFGLAGGVGLLGLWRQRRALWRAVMALRQADLSRRLLIALMLIWMASHALGEPSVYDTGYYHAQTVKWLQSFPIVPGLGNLHDRLGFNNSYFLYAALLDVGPWRGGYFHYANGLLLTALTAQLIMDLPGKAERKRPRAAWLFSALLLAGAVVAGRSDGVSSPTPDMAIFVLGIVISRKLLDMLLEERRDTTDLPALFEIILLSLVGIAVKLNFLAFGLAACGVALGIQMKRGLRAKKAAAMAAALSLGILGPWALRGIILSGYPAYPSTFGAAPVQWKVSEETARTQMRSIRDWARFYTFSPPHQDISAWQGVWLDGCMRNANVALPLAMLPVAGGALLAARPRGRKRKRHREEEPRRGGEWWLLAPPAAWIVYWIFTAPAPRFAGAAFWIIGGGALALALDRAWPKRPARQRAWRRGLQFAGAFGAMFLIVYGVIGEKGAFASTLNRTGSLTDALPELRINAEFLGGHAFYGGLQPMPKALTTVFVTDSKLEIIVPFKGERCWDAPLPCTPYPARGLRLRGRTLREGFVMNENGAR